MDMAKRCFNSQEGAEAYDTPGSAGRHARGVQGLWNTGVAGSVLP